MKRTRTRAYTNPKDIEANAAGGMKREAYARALHASQNVKGADWSVGKQAHGGLSKVCSREINRDIYSDVSILVRVQL